MYENISCDLTIMIFVVSLSTMPCIYSYVLFYVPYNLINIQIMCDEDIIVIIIILWMTYGIVKQP